MPGIAPTRRRRFVASLGSVLFAGSVAGCGDGEGDAGTATPGNGENESPDTTPESPTPTGSSPDRSGTETTARNETEATTGSGPTADLNRREANVVGVTVSHSSGARYDFDVTLDHDDAGEEGYANWWQVESVDGTRHGRRDLAHPHSTQPFTRSATVDLPDDVTCVVVRGHDETHGYGGQVALVTLDDGTSRLVAQGAEPRRFGPGDCP